MDPVSHVVAAWCLNSLKTREARLTAAAPVRGRALAITLGALAPDIDALMMPAGWDRYLAVHELGTHSLPGAVACGAAAAGVVMLVRRRTAYGPLILPAVIGAVSHVAADLLSGASIRIGWPVLDAQVANLGVVAMADPWLLAASLLTGLALTRTRRRHVVAMGAVSTFVLLTIGVSLVRERAERVYRQHPGRGAVVGSYLIEPVSGSVRTWRLLDRTDRTARAWTVHAGGDIRLNLEVPLALGDRALVDASQPWETVRNFRGAHAFAFAVATAAGVEWSDVRYCTAVNGALVPQCGVWAGGKFATPPRLHQLVVRIGRWVQTREVE